jgi:hypothetical protein
MQYDNEMKGRLWKQDGVNPKAPYMKGEFIINGQKKEITIWQEQTPKNGGKPFHRVEIKEPFKKGLDNHNKAKGNGYAPQGDDDIPF